LRRAVHIPWLRFLRPLFVKLLALLEPVKRIRMILFPAIMCTQTKEGITVLSANLWHDWPFRRKLTDRLERFAQLVQDEGVDVVLLQEVSRTPEMGVDEWLAERLGMAFVYTPANGDEAAIGFEEGLAIFSRFPLLSPQYKPLGSKTGFVKRMALAAEVHSPFGDLFAVSVHLGIKKRSNERQWMDFRSWVRDTVGGCTAFIGGDFNVHEGASQIDQAQDLWIDTFRMVNPQADATTHELRLPWGSPFRRRRLDYIFLQPGPKLWSVVEARHLISPQAPYSDHRTVMARLIPARDKKAA
jgi:endonuclease/exonuclease/phosphatase family metal-dependent hydrolase